jgi:hypothetical protein
MSPYAVWAELEALAWFLQLDYIHIWFRKSFSLFFLDRHLVLN